MGSDSNDDGRIDSSVSRNLLIMKLLISILLLASVASVELSGQTDWDFRKEEEGIKAYTRTREGIKINEYLVTMTLETTLNEMLSLFKDFDSHPDIFPKTSDHKVFLDEPRRYITYVRLNIPFPARDRDIVFDNVLNYNSKEKKLLIDIQCIPEQYETNSSLIRITVCDGGWEFKDIGNGQIQIRHHMIVDPAGFAPAFIVNARTIEDPIATLKSIKALISTHPYAEKDFELFRGE
jgi:hypothetical protein